MQYSSDFSEVKTDINSPYSVTGFTPYYKSSQITVAPNIGKETSKWTNAEIARLIQIVVRPILIIIGTTGNSLTFYVMRRSSLKELSSCFYMSLLGLADTLVLWIGCFPTRVLYLTRYRIDPWVWTDCKLAYFLFYFGRHYSSMLLILMSLEKCFAFYFPLKSKTICTVKTAKWVTGVIGTILAVYNLQWFVIMESQVSLSTGHNMCGKTEHFKNAFLSVDSVLYSFGPFALISLTNFAIAFKFMKAKFKSDRSTESTNQALAKPATRGTAMVVTVSVTFLILTSPSAANFILIQNIQLYTIPFYHVFMNIAQYLNHSINGVLYIIVGSRFRMELVKMFSRRERHDAISTSRSVNNTSLTMISDGTRHKEK